jgi:proline dehydrogenase
MGGTIKRDLTQRFVRILCENLTDLKVGFELDMEGQRMVELTLDLAEDCASSGMETTVALQAYLNRTTRDIERMLDAGAKIRLVKGAYTGDISDFITIVEVYKDQVELILGRDVQFLAATHDPDLLEWIQARICDRDIVEFSFLKGLADETKERMAYEGWKVAEYVPFGSPKEGYEARRKTYLRMLEELGRVPAP